MAQMIQNPFHDSLGVGSNGTVPRRPLVPLFKDAFGRFTAHPPATIQDRVLKEDNSCATKMIEDNFLTRV